MNAGIIKSILKEYGVGWAINRGIYSGKLKLMSVIKGSEKIFEKRVGYPSQLDIFDIDTNRIRNFLQNIPQKKKQELIEIADNACEGKILGFSSVMLDYGKPINWQLNPLTKNDCSIQKKWYQIPDFDGEFGDIKVIWEASRFSHFLTFARAYLLTGDKKYYKAFSDQLADWIRKNPYSFGVNFKCGQECSIRMVNGLLAYTVFINEGQSTSQDKENIEILILRCYRKILSNFFYAYKCIKNNHTISELMGMIVGAWCCGEDERLSYAYKTLDKVINEQFTDDGGYKQFSFNYERLALQDLEVVLSLNTGYGLNAQSKKKVLAAANMMYQCQDESGDMPNYGSNDGALVFPVTSCGYRDFRPVINSIHAKLAGTRLYETGDYDEEIYWFGDKKEYPTKNIKRTSMIFNKAGLCTFRRADSWGMIVLNNYKSRPAHMDQLHFDLWINGINVLCDGGTYSYVSQEGHELISNVAHNTVLVGNNIQMNTRGAFMIYNWTQGKINKYTGNIFYGEIKSKNGYSHCRTVEITDKGYRIIDKVRANETYKVLFHTPCDVVEDGDIFELRTDEKILCRIKSTAKGEKAKSLRSLYYLKKEEITCMEFIAEHDTVVTEIEVMGEGK